MKFVELSFSQPDANIARRARAFVAVANAHEITDQSEYDFVDMDLKRIIVLKKKVEEARTAITVPINASLKDVNNFFREPAAWLAEAEKTLRDKMIAFIQVKEAQAREAQLIIAQNNKDAISLAAQTLANAEADAAASHDNADPLMDLAPAPDDNFSLTPPGTTAAPPAAPVTTAAVIAARTVVAALQSTPAVIVKPSLSLGRGTGVRKTWAAEVISKATLVKFIAENFEMYGDLLDVNMSKLTEFARIREGDLKIEGAKATEKSGLVIRTK